jgi:uncharacterized OB-fold protein
MSERIPVADGLFAETKDGARLIGSRCASCRTPYFPKVDYCRNPTCGDSRLEEAGFGPDGTIWSCAIRTIRPRRRQIRQTLQALRDGVWDLADGLRVLGRSRPTTSHVIPDTKVTLVIDNLRRRRRQRGRHLKFRPVRAERRDRQVTSPSSAPGSPGASSPRSRCSNSARSGAP